MEEGGSLGVCAPVEGDCECVPTDEVACEDGQLFAVDSCGVLTEMLSDCDGLGCEDGLCGSESETEDAGSESDTETDDAGSESDTSTEEEDAEVDGGSSSEEEDSGGKGRGTTPGELQDVSPGSGEEDVEGEAGSDTTSATGESGSTALSSSGGGGGCSTREWGGQCILFLWIALLLGLRKRGAFLRAG